MGRAGRKRPLPPPQYGETSAKSPELGGSLRLASFGLRSLVHEVGIYYNQSISHNVQHVWAPINDAEISSSLGLQDIKVDHFGVAWLLSGKSSEKDMCMNHARRLEVPRTQHTTIAQTKTSLLSECDDPLQAELQRLRIWFDDIPPKVFKRVRSACNPAESLGLGPFLNRSAMKLANIDAISDLADPEEARQRPLLFADICGGPGGFSEYLLWRRRQSALSVRGWGISLQGRGTSHPPQDCKDDRTPEFGHDGHQREVDEDVRPDHGGGTVGADSLDGMRNIQNVDPCAWKVERLSPWCDEFLIKNDRERQSAFSTQASATPSPAEASGKGGRSLKGNDSDSEICPQIDSGKENHFELESNRASRWTKEFARQGGNKDGPIDSQVSCSLTGTADSATPNTSMYQMTIDYGPDGTGDLTNMANMRGFVEGVLASTGGKRLDLVVADGGFLEARDALDQEQLLSPLAYCEALAALLLLAEGGTFVCKLFEMWKESTVSLVYVLRRKFRRMAILKPITSRPASSERYIVCKGLMTTDPKCKLVDYVKYKIHDLLLGASVQMQFMEGFVAVDMNKGVELDVPSEMKRDEVFMSYLRMMNDRLAKVQAEACTDILRVSSSARGRAWAFEDKMKNAKETPGGIEGVDALALKMFREAWRLEGIPRH